MRLPGALLLLLPPVRLVLRWLPLLLPLSLLLLLLQQRVYQGWPLRPSVYPSPQHLLQIVPWVCRGR